MREWGSTAVATVILRLKFALHDLREEKIFRHLNTAVSIKSKQVAVKTCTYM